MFSCEFCEISKNTFSYRIPLLAASVLCPVFSLHIFDKSPEVGWSCRPVLIIQKVVHWFALQSTQAKQSFECWSNEGAYPLGTRCKLNVHKTFRRRPGSISFLKVENERQQRQDERFLSLTERMLIPRSPMAVPPNFGCNFQQDSSSSVPERYGVPNRMLHYDHATRNTYENLQIYSIFIVESKAAKGSLKTCRRRPLQ